MNIVSIPGLMSPELAAEFRLAVERAGQSSLEAMTEKRQNLLKNLGDRPRPSENQQSEATESNPDPDSEQESVRGLKMEKIEEPAEKTSISSSGVEWFASLFVLAMLALFFAGLRRGSKR
ncbi:MAG: hypothetical protein LBT15_02115 [Synergistaceae bacterium]|jgi:cobaltochelatase CobN|nr:hypothetical protein [Synergistaceae bacterium]